MLDPAAYVQRVKIASQRQAQQQKLTVEEHTLARAPNYRHKDGRIYASKPGEPYYAVSVSPLNPKFETQIEPGIAPVVSALLERNYLPISSCQGHGDSRSFVRVVFGSKESAEKFISDFGVMQYVDLVFLTTSANIVQMWHNGVPSWRAMYESESVRTELEAVDVNILFARDYLSVCYVDIRLYEMQDGIQYFFKRMKIIRDMHRNKSRRIAEIAERILSMPVYEL